MNFLNSAIFFHRSQEKKLKSGKFLLYFIFLLIISFVILFFSNQTQASRIALTPLVFELSAEKGQTIEEYVRVMNPSYEEKITVIMETEEMFPQGEEGRVRLQIPPEERIPFSLSSWISFEPQKFTLEPREEKPVKFIIKVPENAEPGGHYAGILARTELVGGPSGVGVGIVQRIASLVLLTVPGQMKEEISVAGFETSKSYYEKGPINFSIRFENKGTVHLKPESTITITNFLGQEVAKIAVDPKNVLPGAIRRFDVEWPVKWLWLGKYKATLTGSYGTNKLAFDPKTITFWAFPWKVGILFFLVIIFFVITRKRWLKAIKILIKGEKALKSEK